MFKDETPNVKIIQGEGDNGAPTTLGVLIEADVITNIKRKANDKNEGKSIIYSCEAGETMRCTKCKKEKPRKAYSRHNSRKNGLQTWCIQCLKDAAVARRRKKLEEADNENE